MKIEIDHISYTYPEGNSALEEISLGVASGEFLALLGPSGSGKTTLLFLLAGLNRPSVGAIRLGGKTASDGTACLSPRRREIGMVFQDLALWPHLTVGEHLEFVMRSKGFPREERKRRKDEVLEMVELSRLRDRLPSMLSGGEEQRLALARALATRPSILLLDEPLGALDRELRQKMLQLLLRIHQELRATTIHVTHDPDDALSPGGRAAVLDRGKLLQFGTPEEIYRFPADPVAARIGGPVTLMEGMFREGGKLQLPPGTYAAAFQANPGSKIVAMLRPEQIEVQDHPGGTATVRETRFRAGGWEVDVESGGIPMKGRSAEQLAPGQKVILKIEEPIWGFERDDYRERK